MDTCVEEVLDLDEAGDELEPDDLLDGLDVGNNVNYSSIPEEWVLLVTGLKGGGKGLSIARILVRAMLAKLPIWTNVEFYPDKLLELGIPEEYHPKPIDMDFMLSFDRTLIEGVICIDEIDTWINRMRSNTNLSILITRFITQLRKRRLKVIMSLHFDYVIPRDIHDEIDIILDCKDAYYTVWGKENRVPRGQLIFQTYSDYSGVMTGLRGPIGEYSISNAQNLWPIYNSYQTINPFTFMKSVKIEGNATLVDVSGQDRASIEELWDMPLFGIIMDHPARCKAEIKQKGAYQWLYFKIAETERLAGEIGEYDDVMDNIERIREHRNKPYTHVRRDGRGQIGIQILPELVPELKVILDEANRGAKSA